MRGLKHALNLTSNFVSVVAPYVGAWIETQSVLNRASVGLGRTLRGCVD